MALPWLGLGVAGAQSATAEVSCGAVVSLPTHDGTQTRYALALPSPAGVAEAPVTLVLLPGGAGFLALDEAGCPRRLKGNSLIRAMPLFAAAGFATALVDAPSDHQESDGLGGFRVAPAHAADLGEIIADIRRRHGGAVWLVGTSRGTISAVNAAARLSGAGAPDGVVLTSALMNGDPRARKAWVAQSVFDLPLEAIRIPLLIVGHIDDACVRSPATRMGEVLARVQPVRQQQVTVHGGPGRPVAGVDACEGKSPHGFVEQEAEVAAGIARFVRGGRF